MGKEMDAGQMNDLLMYKEGFCPSFFCAYPLTRFTIDHSPGRICARALLAVVSSSMNRR
jgi:hypothetical protein